MLTHTTPPEPAGAPPGTLGRMARAWDRFWFTPADPTLLGLLRLGCGLIAVYVLVIYTWDLQNFFGEHAWISRERRLRDIREVPFYVDPLRNNNVEYVPPRTPEEQAYAERYEKRWGTKPPPPYPKDEAEAEAYDMYRQLWKFDPRFFRLPLPRNNWEAEYVTRYVQKWNNPPPPPYPRDQAEADAIDRYHEEWNADPRVAYTRGMWTPSLWLYVTDPTWMAVLHGAILAVTVLFTIGFATRLTSVLTWVGMLNYLHRAPTTLFGMDTMMNILFIYLAIGPSGAALSVDRLIARWWARGRPGFLGRWRAFWSRLLGREPPSGPIRPGTFATRPAPSVTANVAIRLLQIHVCIIYLAAGLAKLRGQTWWNGTAVWYTLANFEFAPLHHRWYLQLLRAISREPLAWEVLCTFGTAFTLFFEVTYAFLVWRPSMRWVMLGMAMILHGIIGTLMGLGTFALIMLVMNMAFLKPAEAHWLARMLQWPFTRRSRIFAAKHPEVRPAVHSESVAS